MTRVVVPAILSLLTLSVDQGLAAREAAKETFFIIPHTHWEGAVFKTREEYLEIGLPYILRALRLLKAHPNYRFVLDQACYVKPFLERYPEEEATFRKLIGEGEDIYDALAAEMPTEPTRLLTLPYFETTGPPQFVSDASGAIVGLKSSTTRGQILGPLAHLGTDVVGRSEGKRVLGVYAPTPERQTVAELSL